MIFFLLSTLRHSHIIANSPPPSTVYSKGFYVDISFETKNATAKVRFEAVFTYQVWVTIADPGQLKVKEMPEIN